MVFDRVNIHIHVPAGAQPKDGPSAGIAMATAIISAFTQRPVRRDVSMTGEVTLRGKVLAIGGLKSKAIAAHRAGIKTVLLPKDNAKDLQELPEQVRAELNLVAVGHLDEVLDLALLDTVDAPVSLTPDGEEGNTRVVIPSLGGHSGDQPVRADRG
jgi:ATP-dependent Lon protease